MPYCSICGNQIDKNSIFCPVCGERVGIVVRFQHQETTIPPFQQDSQLPFKPNSGMGLAIFSTLCCCPLLGIYAMVLAGKVDSLYYLGYYREAEMKASDSKKWSIIGIVFGFIMEVIVIIAIIIVIVAADGDVDKILEILG